ncbi:hypothetical protein GC177_01490 [bacterium]|nr:hypothetical protein [bacterium]
MLFYIMHEGQETGPYDMAGLVRKVKNGSLQPNSLVRTDASQTHLPASQYQELQQFFQNDLDHYPASAPAHRGPLDLKQIIKGGWKFASTSTHALKATGIGLIITVVLCALLVRIPFYIGLIPAFAIGFLIYGILFTYIAKFSRGQFLELSELKARAKDKKKDLFLAGLVLSIPVMVGSVLFLAPGILVLSLFAFTPLLIMERGMGFKQAMGASRKAVTSMNADNFGILFTLMAILTLGGVMGILPLLVILPMVIYGLTEIFDEAFQG